jgi:hypothetical protein
MLERDSNPQEFGQRIQLARSRRTEAEYWSIAQAVREQHEEQF